MAEFIISKSKVLEQFSKVESISDIVSYSSKTNPLIGNILEDNSSCMFSIHMESELKNVKDMSRVIFLAQGWDINKIGNLVDLGIVNFVVDNIIDLEVLEKYLE